MFQVNFKYIGIHVIIANFVRLTKTKTLHEKMGPIR